jgi:hypothetical protein
MNLKITCNTNPDIPGEWNQAEVEQEMSEFGIDTSNGDEWLDYILGHVFDDVALDSTIYNAIMNPDVQTIIFKTDDNDVVKVVKSN